MSDAEIKAITGMLGPLSSVATGILTLALIGMGIYLRRYLEQKALNLATRKDFEELQKQLLLSTEAVEKVKSLIGNADWVRKERHGLRVKKIEELITLALNCEEVLEAHRNAAIEAKYYMIPRHYDRMCALAIAYLPELEALSEAYRAELIEHSLQIGRRQHEASKGGGLELWNDFLEKSNYRAALAARDKLIKEAARLLQQTAGGGVFT
jgi:hypothetical protein